MMRTKENPFTGQGLGAYNKTQPNITSNSSQAQRERILAYLLACGSLTTIKSRESLDCMHPAGRVMELRRQGHEIETHFINELNEAGKFHRVARYVLVGGADEQL